MLHIRAARDVNMRSTTEVFDWYRCLCCATLTIKPDVGTSRLARYYPPDYGPHHKQLRMFGPSAKHPIGARILFLQTEYGNKPFRLLDVGCGSGQLLFALAHHFPNAELYGFDIDIGPPAHNLAHTNVILFSPDFAAIPTNAQFDVISSSQFIEHLEDPPVYRVFVTAHLSAGGTVIDDLPNIESRSARMFGSHWVHIDTPRHRNLPTQKALMSLHRDMNVEIRTLGSLDAYTESLMILLKLRSIGGWRRHALTRIGNMLFRLLRVPLDDKFFTIARKSF